jgi:NAD(P)-dependent dehydrogenase (short-subunit alcohol dehydrogenase family)
VLSERGRDCVETYDLPLDVADPRSRSAFLDHCERRGDAIDILINNAAVCCEGWSADVVRRTFRTNVLGPLALRDGLLPGMLQRRRGFVINISSGDGELLYLHTSLQKEFCAVASERQLMRLLARVSPPRDEFGDAPAHGPTPAYCVSKAALNAATRLASRRLPQAAECGVWQGAVCPGDVLTRMCTDHEAALTAEAAAEDVLWLVEHQALDGGTLPSGRFWRGRAEIQP